MLMCFYLLPFLALSRRGVEELPMPPCPASLGCPVWALHCRAAPGQGLGGCTGTESGLGDRTGLVGFLLQLLLQNQGLTARGGAGLWGSLCCLFSAPAPAPAHTGSCPGLSWIKANPLLLVAAAERAGGAGSRHFSTRGTGILGPFLKGSPFARQQDLMLCVDCAQSPPCADGLPEGRTWPGEGLGVFSDG